MDALKAERLENVLTQALNHQNKVSTCQNERYCHPKNKYGD